MSEQNIVNVMVIPDVPKVLPGEQLYVYVPKASFTFPGIIAYNNTQFRIDGNFLFIREDYVSPGVQQKIDELKQYTDDELQLKQDKEDNNISLAQRPEQKSVVGAINDLGTLTQEAKNAADHAQTTADNATTLANTGINKADRAQSTADNAQRAAETAQAAADNATTLANTGISKAEQAQSTANTAVDKANDAKATAQEAIMKADGRATSIGFMTAKDAVTALNGYPRTQLKGGDTIWIVEDGTPDLWVTDVAQESIPYNYTTKDKFNQDLVDNKVLQIGYFKTAYQESDGKPVTIAWQNVLVKSTDWVASTEFADFPYEAKIELTDFVDYTTVPQVVFDIADTMSGNYAPICKSGDKCVYIYGKVQDEITLKTVITFAPNVNGASVTGGGYNNRGKWVASTTYEIDDLVYTDNGQYVCIEGITSTTSPEQDTQHWQATFVANVPVKSVNGQTGAVTIEVPTKTSQLTNDSGFITANDIPTVPEALPQEASALKSGNLPTSGWITPEEGWKENTLPADSMWWSVIYGNGKFVAVARNSTNGAYSMDGITWTEMLMPASRDWKSVTYGNDKFVAVASGSANGAYSTDGINWTEMTLPASKSWQSVTYGDGKYVAVASDDSDKGAYSTDGITWTQMSMSTIQSWQSVTYGDGKFVAVAYNSKKGAYSTDGVTWTEMTLTAGHNWRITYGNDKFVAVAVDWKDGAYSTDGITWTKMFMPESKFWSSVTYGDGKFVAVASDSNKVAYSTDGINWTGMTLPEGHNGVSVAYGDGKFVVVSGRANGAYWNVAAKQVTYVISDASVTTNSDVLMELTDDGGVKASSLTNGSIEVVRDTVPTQPIQYTYKVKQTNASGQFTLVNHFVPNIPESPTSLPVTYKKASGSLPTSGWGYSGEDTLWEGQCDIPANTSVSRTILSAGSLDFNGLKENKETSDWLVLGSTLSTYSQPNRVYISDDGGIYLYFFSGARTPLFRITPDGSLECNSGGYSAQSFSGLKTTKGVLIYSISDNAITINSSVKMYLTDEKIKPYNKVDGSIIVTRNVVPTQPIPYKYEVEQTSTEGLFEIINDYVPVTSVNGQTGAVTITVPTKTSQLENDSNFAKTNVSNSWGSTQTFTASDGIKTNRICNAAGTSLVDGTGTTNKFGNGNMPTIIKTSEARPKAEVPYADGTVTRQIALLEDIPSMVIDWVGPSATEQVITGTGMRQIFAEFTDTVGDVSTLYKFYGEVYVDGQNEVNGTSSTVYSTNTDGTELHVITVTPTIRRNTDNQFVLRAECCRYTIGASPMSINKSYLSFVFRKRLY